MITVTWDLPPCGSRGGEIYIYEYFFGNNTDEWMPSNTDFNNATFTNLARDTKYMFKVRAFTSVGPGRFTSDMTMQTKKMNSG